MNNSNQLYQTEPVRYEEGIPIFSEIDEYVENYELISADHLKGLEETGENPFMPEASWIEMEDSTVALINKYSKPGQNILDVGVGLGRLLSRTQGLNKHGMDISLSYLKIAKEKDIQVCRALVEDMPFPPQYFDVVTCTDVLEHVLDLNVAVEKLLSVLKQDGTLIVRVPYLEHLQVYLGDDYPYGFAHLRAFSESSLRLMFEKIFKCKVVETSKVWDSASRPSSRLKIRKHFLLRDRLYTLIFSILRKTAPKLHRKLLEFMYHPIEINIVVTK